MPFEPEPGATSAALSTPEGIEEARAWGVVVAAWGDEAAHRAYLARFSDLAGLALAGRRYRAVLAERPDDAVAARWRDEIVKRAAVQGIAQLPRTPTAKPVSPWVMRVAVGVAGSLLAWAAWKLATLLSRHPAP